MVYPPVKYTGPNGYGSWVCRFTLSKVNATFNVIVIWQDSTSNTKNKGPRSIGSKVGKIPILRKSEIFEQLTHAMSRYHLNTVGLCEMRWKNFGEMSTDDGHKVYFSGEEGKREYGVGFLVHKDVVGAVLGCQPVSSIRQRAAPFNITIIQVYAPTSGHDDSEVGHFYQQLQETIDKTPKKTFWLYKGLEC